MTPNLLHSVLYCCLSGLQPYFWFLQNHTTCSHFSSVCWFLNMTNFYKTTKCFILMCKSWTFTDRTRKVAFLKCALLCCLSAIHATTFWILVSWVYVTCRQIPSLLFSRISYVQTSSAILRCAVNCHHRNKQSIVFSVNVKLEYLVEYDWGRQLSKTLAAKNYFKSKGAKIMRQKN